MKGILRKWILVWDFVRDVRHKVKKTKCDEFTQIHMKRLKRLDEINCDSSNLGKKETHFGRKKPKTHIYWKNKIWKEIHPNDANTNFDERSL